MGKPLEAGERTSPRRTKGKVSQGKVAISGKLFPKGGGVTTNISSRKTTDWKWGGIESAVATTPTQLRKKQPVRPSLKVRNGLYRGAGVKRAAGHHSKGFKQLPPADNKGLGERTRNHRGGSRIQSHRD